MKLKNRAALNIQKKHATEGFACVFFDMNIRQRVLFFPFFSLLAYPTLRFCFNVLQIGNLEFLGFQESGNWTRTSEAREWPFLALLNERKTGDFRVFFRGFL